MKTCNAPLFLALSNPNLRVTWPHLFISSAKHGCISTYIYIYIIYILFGTPPGCERVPRLPRRPSLWRLSNRRSLSWFPVWTCIVDIVRYIIFTIIVIITIYYIYISICTSPVQSPQWVMGTTYHEVHTMGTLTCGQNAHAAPWTSPVVMMLMLMVALGRFSLPWCVVRTIPSVRTVQT